MTNDPAALHADRPTGHAQTGEQSVGRDQPLEGQGRRPRPRWLRRAGLAAGLGVFGALGWVVISQWRSLPERALRPNVWLVVGSFLVFRAAAVLASLRWLAVLRALGGSLSVRKAFVIHTFAMLGRYIPGKVAMVGARAYLCMREGVAARPATLSALYDQGLHILAMAAVVAASLGLWGTGQTGAYAWLGAGVVGLMLVGLHPRVVSLSARVAGRVLGRRLVVEGIPYRVLLALGVAYVLVWVLQGVALYVLVLAFEELPLSYVADCVGIQALATFAGLVCLFAPSGLGVREGVIACLLSARVPLALAAAVSIVHRLIMTSGELCSLGAALLLRSRQPAAPLRAGTAVPREKGRSGLPSERYLRHEESCHESSK